MFTSRRGRLAAIAGVGVLMSACGETTAPELGMEFDTEAALADYAALDAVFASPEFAGFQALGNRTPFGSSPAAIDVVAGMSAPTRADAGRSFALDLVRLGALPMRAIAPDMLPSGLSDDPEEPRPKRRPPRESGTTRHDLHVRRLQDIVGIRLIPSAATQGPAVAVLM